MLQSQPTASLRVLSATLYDLAGAPLSSGTSWLAGMVKISKANGAFANTTNLPTAVTGGADNSFKLQLEIAEVDTLGPLRIQFFDSVGGDLIAEYTDDVVAGVDVVVSVDGVAESLLDVVLDANAPEGAQTLKEAFNLVTSYIAGPGTGFPFSLVQSLTFKSLGGDKTRIAGSVSNGERTISQVDGT